MGDEVDSVRAALDPYVRSGQLPGYVAGWRRNGETEICAAGTMAVGCSDEMGPQTIFAVASLSKPVGAAVALSLVEEGKLGIDDDIGRWLPELAAPEVLKRIDGPMADTIAAPRPILVEDLLKMTAGFGLLMGPSPLQKAMIARGLMPGPIPPPFSPDEYMARLGALPLALGPGEGWLYHTCADVLTVLLSRVTGQSPATLLRERIAEPLGMSDTAFFAPDPVRRATAYTVVGSHLAVLDPPDGAFAKPPAFESFGSGLVSTIPDYLAFQAMLADGGGPVLSSESVALMSTDRLTDEQRASAQAFLGPDRTWGLMVEVCLARAPESGLGSRSFGWMGGTGTTAYVDPAAGLIGALFTQRAMETNRPTDYFNSFWRALYGQPERERGRERERGP
jgi:CubicO group peptidase (beta-lactamase class C family)